MLTQRFLPNGLLVKADRSDHGGLLTDRAQFRAVERFDITLVPNQGASIVKITGINAPAP